MRGAEQGDGVSMYCIAELYRYGHGVDKNGTEALIWYRQAAGRGVPGAMRAIGDLHRDGEGVSKDYREAMNCYRKAAEQGDVYAFSAVGYLYRDGIGVKQDGKEAAQWFQKGAERGDVGAFASLGHLYYDGAGLKRDRTKALEYFRKHTATPDEEYHEYSAMRAWLCLASMGKRAEAKAELAAYLKKHEPKGWPAALMRFLLGELTGDQLIEKAKTIEGEETKEKERLCEAYFYLASKQLFMGDKKAARGNFEKCIATEVTDYTEYVSSKAELALLPGK
jgi:hypothetical protein